MTTETKKTKLSRKEAAAVRNGFKTIEGLKKSRFAVPDPVPEDDEEEYAVGCLPSIPFNVVYLGGVAFPRITDPPAGMEFDEEEGTAVMQRSYNRGDVVPMSKRKAEHVIDCISKRVFRRMAGKPKKDEVEKVAKGEKKEKSLGVILNTNTDPEGPSRYVPDRRDEPMAAHVFMFKLADANEIGIDPRWQSLRKAKIPSLLDLAVDDTKQ